MELKIEYVPIDSIHEYSGNAKKHPKRQIEQIAKSIQEFGFNDAIAVWHDEVVEGHGRLLAARSLGMDKVPVIRLDGLTDEQRKAYTLIHNQLTLNSENDLEKLKIELESIKSIDMPAFDLDLPKINIKLDKIEKQKAAKEDVAAPMQHNVFENQDRMQFPCNSWYGMPEIKATNTTSDKFLRFADWKEIDSPEEYIAHFYYDDYKFISAWREPDKYIERLRKFKAVVSPDFSLYTDFPRALQILSCYRRQWRGAYWQYLGIDVIPDVVWGDKESFSYCFDGIPKHSTVAVSSVGVKRDNEWNNKESDMFKAGFDEMLKRLEPTTILYYGDMIDGLEGNIIRIPSFYEQKREMLNERARLKNGERKKQERRRKALRYRI